MWHDMPEEDSIPRGGVKLHSVVADGKYESARCHVDLQVIAPSLRRF